MADYLVTDTELTQIASAVRSKLGITNSFVYPTGLADAINSITNGKYFYDANYPSISYVYDKFCTSIKSSAFNGCRSLTSVSFPACTTIRQGAFVGCRSLTSVSFPACTTIGSQAFYVCRSLTSVSFPSCITICDMAFQGCTNLTSVNFPVCTTIGSGAFRVCSYLTSVSFPACTTIGEIAFQNCKLLSVIYLAKNSVVTLGGSNAFLGTGITSTTGSIRVPSSLVNSYKTANNWSYFSNRIFAI